jgi:Arc/MetJ-type ribon-helix-helix transcriptional regulator
VIATNRNWFAPAQGVLKCLTDGETLTISLPKRLRRDLEKMAKAEGVSSSEYVRRAIKADIFRRALRATRRELVPKARAMGNYTDEDVFIQFKGVK